jgi:hypothetical protein
MCFVFCVYPVLKDFKVWESDYCWENRNQHEADLERDFGTTSWLSSYNILNVDDWWMDYFISKINSNEQCFLSHKLYLISNELDDLKFFSQYLSLTSLHPQSQK